MYGLIWRLLPGPWPVRVLASVVLVAAVVVACFLWVFPAVEPHMPFNQQTVEEQP